MKFILAFLLFVSVAGCETTKEFDAALYLEMPKEERILRTLAEENYNGQDELEMHFVFFTESIEDAEVVTNRLKEDERTTRVGAYRFPPHQGALVRGESAPMVVNRESLAAFRSRLENVASPSGAFLLSWGVQIYMAPRQDVDEQDLGVRRVRKQFTLMNANLKKILQKVENANINAANAAQFERDLWLMAADVYGGKDEIQILLGKFYETDFEDWYFELTLLCELLEELLEDLFPIPGPNDAAGYDTWKRVVLIELNGIKEQISDIQELLQNAIDAYPPDVGGIPHPLTQHLRDLKAQLERLKERIDRTRQIFADTDDYQVILQLLDELRGGKHDFIIDLPQAPANQFTLYGVSFYEWFNTLKLFDEALDRIFEFEFRDPTDNDKTSADLNRLKQAINETRAFKELMEKWELEPY